MSHWDLNLLVMSDQLKEFGRSCLRSLSRAPSMTPPNDIPIRSVWKGHG
ncbi:hypothetical protein AZE42_08912 [Rhizopogon vesiculosus]|uniref:Uncharacterized protein n=1 Tax=Rhizopogon vesiculosus TaxID=180088 RepID=A0A1J8PG70_9AGAM|nr:hypothetical protein AZE42_08912 [Rhizopogon vesiculosus]